MSRFVVASLLLLTPLLAGCDCSCGTSKDMAAHRAKLLLADEPADAQGILDLRESITGEPTAVVLVGRIGGGKPVFSEDHASFVVIDPATASHDHPDGCDENCPFCSQNAKEQAVAYVQCVDANGQTLEYSANRLLDLAEGQTIVVRGHAHIDSFGNLIVQAEGIYIRG